MAVINIRKNVLNHLKQEGKSIGLKYYNIELGDLDVRIKNVVYKNISIKQLNPQTIDRIEAGPNCTSASQTLTFERNFSVTKEFGWSLSSTLSYSSEVSASVSIPEVADLGGKTTYSISVTGTVSGKENATKGEKVTVPVTVPPCSKVTVPIVIASTEYSGNIEVEVEIRGKATAYIDVDWAFDPKVNLVIFQKLTIPGTFKGVKGRIVNAQWQQTEAECPPGSPCHNKPGRDDKTGQPPKETGRHKDQRPVKRGK
jgi:hypothetical protein